MRRSACNAVPTSLACAARLSNLRHRHARLDEGLPLPLGLRPALHDGGAGADAGIGRVGGAEGDLHRLARLAQPRLEGRIAPHQHRRRQATVLLHRLDKHHHLGQRAHAVHLVLQMAHLRALGIDQAEQQEADRQQRDHRQGSEFPWIAQAVEQRHGGREESIEHVSP
ncbi:hypothetical protein [Denitromonas sp.]|uniref:hypothetical protein n=1 Tax=Denitromonas sp. TaxID=2734609 RepID=UPI002AFF8A46|nr:hypothetical protein [Denitromonas sp.]